VGAKYIRSLGGLFEMKMHKFKGVNKNLYLVLVRIIQVFNIYYFKGIY
jgi:hypothetical protein